MVVSSIVVNTFNTRRDLPQMLWIKIFQIFLSSPHHSAKALLGTALFIRLSVEAFLADSKGDFSPS